MLYQGSSAREAVIWLDVLVVSLLAICNQKINKARKRIDMVDRLRSSPWLPKATGECTRPVVTPWCQTTSGYKVFGPAILWSTDATIDLENALNPNL